MGLALEMGGRHQSGIPEKCFKGAAEVTCFLQQQRGYCTVLIQFIMRFTITHEKYAFLPLGVNKSYASEIYSISN